MVVEVVLVVIHMGHSQGREVMVGYRGIAGVKRTYHLGPQVPPYFSFFTHVNISLHATYIPLPLLTGGYSTHLWVGSMDFCGKTMLISKNFFLGNLVDKIFGDIVDTSHCRTMVHPWS